MKKKTKNELMHMLLDYCVELTEKGHTAFFEYTAHCHYIDIKVYKNGWRSGSEWNLWETVKLNELSTTAVKKIITKINKLIK